MLPTMLHTMLLTGFYLVLFTYQNGSSIRARIFASFTKTHKYVNFLHTLFFVSKRKKEEQKERGIPSTFLVSPSRPPIRIRTTVGYPRHNNEVQALCQVSQTFY